MPGSHATTFGGTPLITAAALRALQLISEPAFLQRVRETGEYLAERLRSLQARHRVVREVRGRGLMLGVQLSVAGQPVVERCLQKGVVLNCTHETVLRLVPPLIVGRQEIDHLIQVLDEVLTEVSA